MPFGIFIGRMGAAGIAGSSTPAPPPPSGPTLDSVSSLPSYVGDSTPIELNLTTTSSKGMIIVCCNSHEANQSNISITAPGLTFTPRTSFTANANYVYVFSAPYTSAFSGTITAVDNGASGFFVAMAFAVANATGFDTNSSLPVEINGNPITSATFSTTADQTFAFFVGGCNDTGGNTAPDGWTVLASVVGNYEDVMGSTYNTAQTNTTLSLNSANQYVVLVLDALA